MIVSSIANNLPRLRSALSIDNPRGWEPVFGHLETNSGQTVSPDSAMGVITVQACVRILSTLIASLPVYIYRKDGEGRERDTSLPLYGVLHDQPNPFQTAFEFWEMMITHACYRGRGIARQFDDGRGNVTALVPINPDRVKAKRVGTGRLVYTVTMPEAGEPMVLTQDQVFDMRLVTLDGYTPVSLIQLHKEGIGLAMGMEQHAATFFKNDASPSGVLKTASDYDAVADKAMKESWIAAHSGANKNSIAVLWKGMEFQKIGMTSEEAQFLESRRYQRSDIANIFGIPVYLLNDLEKGASFASVEQVNKSLIDFTFRPWAKRIEQCIRRDLIADPETYSAEFSFDALLRGSTKERYEAHQLALLNGWKNVNEVRRDENMNPIPGGETYRVQMQNVPINGAPPTQSPPGGAQAVADGPAVVAFDVRPLLADAARRICASERSWIGRRAKHADNGGREMFLEQFGQWSVKHNEFIVETVAPIAQACGIEAKALWPVAERWTFETGEALASAEVVSAVVDAGDREGRFADAMREVLDGKSGSESSDR